MQFTNLKQSLVETHATGRGGQGGDYVVKSAGRVLRILELFDNIKRESSVTEVAWLLDIPQSSVTMLLQSLVKLGYLYYNPETRGFIPTSRVALLGNWINGGVVGRGPLIQFLARVGARTGQTVVLATRNQIWSEYIHVIQAAEPLRIFIVKGSRRSLIRSGTGHALLADLQEAEIKRIAVRLNSGLKEGEPHSSLSKLLEQVSAVRSRGYAVTCDGVTKGAGVVAMRLPGLITNERFVVGVAGRTEVIRERKEIIVRTIEEEIGRCFDSFV